MLGKSISRNSLILTAFALVTAGLLAFTYQNTADKIANEEKKAAERALLEIVPASKHDNDMVEDLYTLSAEQSKALGLDEQDYVHVARLNGEPSAVIIPAVAPDGYSGKIKMIVGVYVNGKISGVRVLSHKETPGLGDKVDLKKSPWVISFNGKSLQNPNMEKWAVRKDGGDFDQFTGATITPRAVVNRVKQTLEFFEENKSSLLELDNNQH